MSSQATNTKERHKAAEGAAAKAIQLAFQTAAAAGGGSATGQQSRSNTAGARRSESKVREEGEEGEVLGQIQASDEVSEVLVLVSFVR